MSSKFNRANSSNMCYCTVLYWCGHMDQDFRPLHCKCDSSKLEDKVFTRRCDDCGDIVPHKISTRDEGRRFKNESTSQMLLRLAKYREEDCKEVDKERLEDVGEGVNLSDCSILGETSKPYSRHIEHLGKLRDGEKRHQDEKEGRWVPKRSRTQ